MRLVDKPVSTKEFLFLSDFDQTLSFQDSGHALSEALGIPNFHKKVADSPDLCCAAAKFYQRSARVTRNTSPTFDGRSTRTSSTSTA